MARRLALILLVMLPGGAAVLVSGYYLFQDWGALISAFARLERAILTGDPQKIAVAQAYDSIYRLNAFADGVGVMLGAILFAIGLHGLCTLPAERVADVPASEGARMRTRAKAVAAVAGVACLLTGGLLCSLVYRVGATNEVRRAIIRGDVKTVRALAGRGVDVNDSLWWDKSPRQIATTQAPAVVRSEILQILQAGRRGRSGLLCGAGSPARHIPRRSAGHTRQHECECIARR